MTLISAKPIPREVPIFCDDNQNNKIKNCSDTPINNTISGSSLLKKKIFPSSLTINENHKWWNSDNSTQNTPKTQRLRNLFKLTNERPPITSENPNVADAMNKLCNLAMENSTKGSTANIPSAYNRSISRGSSKNKAKNASSTKLFSSSYLDEKINFNEEDDEINEKLWNNLKSSKFPFTNTITLGRRFKKNVLKLSIFNSFNINTTNTKEADVKIVSPTTSTNLKENKTNSNSPASPQANTNNNTATSPTSTTNPNNLLRKPTNISSSKNKLLKTKKKLERIIDAANNHKIQSDTKNQIMSPNPNIYKTI